MKYSNVYIIAVLVALLAAAGVYAVSAGDSEAAAPKDSGEAFVADISTYLNDTVGDDIAKATYSDGLIEIYADPMYVFSVSANPSVMKSEAFEYYDKYTDLYLGDKKLKVNGTADMPLAAKTAACIAGQILDTVCASSPGEVVVYTADDVYLKKTGVSPFNGSVVVIVNLTQNIIDFARFGSNFVDIDEETGDVSVNIDAFGVGDSDTLKDLVESMSVYTADDFFGPEYGKYINQLVGYINGVPNAVNSPSIIWEQNGIKYKITLKNFKPGSGDDEFQKLINGIADSMDLNPEGYESGWEVPLGDFKDPETGDYVFSGEAIISYTDDKGNYYEVPYDFSGEIDPQDYYYDITIVYIGAPNGTVKTLPWINGEKIRVSAIPFAGCVLKSLTVTINGVTTDIMESMTFTLNGDAVITAEFIKPVTGVSLDKSDIAIAAGETATLTATVIPAGATNPRVSWSTSDSSVATVSNGVVAGVAPGTATITVTTEDGGYKAYCNVTVTSAIPVTGVTLDKSSLTLTAGDSATLTAAVAPANATNKTVYWSTSDSSVATVSNGKVTAVAPGTATITVTTDDGGYKAYCDVTVTSVVPVTGVTLNTNELILTAGDSATLTAIVAPSDATNKNVSWSTSNANVAAVSNGKVTAVSAGSATITVTTVDGGFTADCKVIVVPPVIRVTGVSLSAVAIALVEGDDMTLTATVVPDNATNKNVSWSTSNAAVATVADGKVTAVAPGTAVITVTTEDGGFTADCDVTVFRSGPGAKEFAESFLKYYDGAFGVLEVENASFDYAELKTHGNPKTKIDNPKDPGATRDYTIQIYHFENTADAEAKFIDALVNSRNGSQGGTAITQTDKVGMASNFVTLKDYRESGAEVYGADKAYFLYGSYYKKDNNGYTQCIGAALYGNDVVVINNTSDKIDLYCYYPIQDSDYTGTDCITQEEYETMLGNFARAFAGIVYVPVTGVTLSASELEITLGETATLTAEVLPANATNKNVAWSSSNTDVVTVVDGKVTAVSVGTANVAVTTEDGAFSEVCKVIVIPAPVPVTGVTLDKSSLTLTAGDSATLTATVAPSDATNKNVAWSSSDAKVAIVVDGKVTAVSAGTATITVTTEDGEFSATCAVTVVSPVKVTGVSLDKTKVTINVGDTVKLTATVTPSDAANKKVSWSTSDSKIVTVSDGTVKGVSKGTATVTVTTDDGGYTATCTVTVEEPSSSGDNTLLYVGIAAAVIIAILVAIYFLRMRK